MATCYLENLGKGKFNIHELPIRSQFAPVYGMAADDYNQDGHLDLLMVGNSYAANVQDGWYDASIGTVLAGNGKGGFKPLSLKNSGFYVDTDAKGVATFYTAEQKPHLLITSNADSVQVWSTSQNITRQMIALQPDEYYAILTDYDGKAYRQEFYYGNTYLSQSSRHFSIDFDQVEKITIYNFLGNPREIHKETLLTIRK